MRDKPKLSKGTQNITKKMGIKNVFVRQQVLRLQKEAEKRESKISERYKCINGITSKPEINEKSKSLQRTIDDLYIWEERKQKKLEAERKKSNSPSHEIVNNLVTRNPMSLLPVEDRLIYKGK